MGWGTPDVYYQPEHFGLTIVGSISDPDADWSFDEFVVWQHSDGRLFYGSDSGCSCPSPFEDFHSLEDLTEITDETWDAFVTDAKAHCYHDRLTEGQKNELAADQTELLAKVHALRQAS